MLIEAWKIVQSKHPNWSLHIYGSHDGDMGDYDHLVQIIEKTCLDQVFLHPAINDVYPRYCESDFLVVSSRFESFGLVMIEAMSCGLPVVAFDCNYGPRTIVSDGETGILVPSSDVKQLAESISFMIENVDERTRMGDNSLVTVAKYKPERIFSIWKEFYQTL